MESDRGSRLAQIRSGVEKGGDVGISILKNTPKEAFTSAAEGAKASAKISENTARIAEAEESTARSDFQCIAEVHRAWMSKAETPEERSSVQNSLKQFADASELKWAGSREGRMELQVGAIKVANLATLAAAAAAIGLTLFLRERFGKR